MYKDNLKATIRINTEEKIYFVIKIVEQVRTKVSQAS